MNRIKELRKAKGVSQIEVAKAVNLATTAICNYEVGLRNPKEEHRKALADYFGVSIGYLMGYEIAEADEIVDGINISQLARNYMRFLRNNITNNVRLSYKVTIKPDKTFEVTKEVGIPLSVDK